MNASRAGPLPARDVLSRCIYAPTSTLPTLKTSAPMPQQDLYIGLGSVAYALAKMDGRLQPEEAAALQQLLREETHGEIACNAFSFNDQYGVKAEDAYQFAFRRFTENRRDLNADLKKK